jgi:mRNA interferase HigB
MIIFSLISFQSEKILAIMHAITRRHLSEAANRYRDTASEISAWVKIVEDSRWENFMQVRQTFPDADNVDGYVIFNVRHNRYRLVTIIHYARERNGNRTMGHVYVRSFLTHKEYDNRSNWDDDDKEYV